MLKFELLISTFVVNIYIIFINKLNTGKIIYSIISYILKM